MIDRFRSTPHAVLLVLDAGAGNDEHSLKAITVDNSWIRVRCKKCGHEWLIDNG